MLNLLRKFLRPTLREQLEDGVREALRRYADRHTTPNLRVYVSTDLVPENLDPGHWRRDENEHLRRFALQWAEDNNVPRAGMKIEVILLDTKREFAFVKPVGLDPAEEGARDGGAAAAAPPRSAPVAPVQPPAPAAMREAILEVISSPSLTQPLRVGDEVTVGRKSDGSGVTGIGDRYMSSRHARFHLSGGVLYVTDLDSKNRTFVNERPLPPHQQTPLSPGDQVRMGATTLRVAPAGA
jgi:hypothetical protein